MNEEPNLSESRAMEIAKQYAVEQGITDFYIPFATYFEAGYWNIPVGLNNKPLKMYDNYYIQVIDETGKVRDPPWVSDDVKKYDAEVENASHTMAQVIEIATQHALDQGFRDFIIDFAFLNEGRWNMYPDFGNKKFDSNIMELDTPGSIGGDRVLIQVIDETGQIAPSPF